MNHTKDTPGGASSAQGGDQATKEAADKEALHATISRIKHTILVLSGKGGVGKSTVAVNLASSLAEKKMKTGLLDIDIHGPSVPKLLGLEKNRLMADKRGKLIPVEYGDRLKVISIGFLQENRDEAIIWRGPVKFGVIKQFLADVDWGDLDYLVVDSPPGTGDEPLTICQLIAHADGAVIVTTPQDVALSDVRKSINFCKQLNMPVIGVIENMSGFTCPHCGKVTDIFKNGGGEAMAADMRVPFLGSIPIESGIVTSGDAGNPFNTKGKDGRSPAQESFSSIIENIIKGAHA